MMHESIDTERATKVFLTSNIQIQQIYLNRLRDIEREVTEYGELIREYSPEDLKQISEQLCRMFTIQENAHREQTDMMIGKYEEELKEAHDRIDKLQDKVYKFDLLTNRETPNE